MLSKMMAPDAAKSYIESITPKKTKVQTSPSSSLNGTLNDSQECKENDKTKKSSRSLNANWNKFKETIKDFDTKTSSATNKPSIKRQSTNSICYPSVQGKRKASGKTFPISTDAKGKKQNCTRPNMDLENMTLTKQVAMDCEMVGIGDGSESMLARISIVNRHGACIYDKYVKPREIVQDYRTSVSGIRPHHLKDGEEFTLVQKEVADILKGRILVGHALKNDLSVLFLSHPKRLLRDTSRYNLFRRVTKGNTPSLKKLAAELLGIQIQTGEHNSVEDARTAMELYVLYKNRWESDIYSR
ncbi:hypothetical protein PV328_010739 [Microctonus aethiopoides]|uniref:RNA exonuclease 4 n=1 Tax=Microctonus aethiopoides TaxID=144406 RepID=A0AA39KQS9_9HYME|nr:hypothetical protein PV328_010739 [Microctonus aethiopoides]